jgi:hypothetical protein
MTVVDRLNELLEAERAGVETLSDLYADARSPEMRSLFEAVRNDEAWSCAGLARSIKVLGNRGQGWVVKRIDGLLGETLVESVSEFLEEMKVRHVANIEACDRLAASLT